MWWINEERSRGFNRFWGKKDFPYIVARVGLFSIFHPRSFIDRVGKGRGDVNASGGRHLPASRRRSRSAVHCAPSLAFEDVQRRGGTSFRRFFFPSEHEPHDRPRLILASIRHVFILSILVQLSPDYRLENIRIVQLDREREREREPGNKKRTKNHVVLQTRR